MHQRFIKGSHDGNEKLVKLVQKSIGEMGVFIVKEPENPEIRLQCRKQK